MTRKQIHFNGFVQNSPAPHAAGHGNTQKIKERHTTI